jgi:aldehyde dehydrogenase (NAD+)
MKIAKEEIFGPVMSILKWKDEEDVIKRANSLPYGLAAGIVTNDVHKINKFANKLKAGIVFVNCYGYAEAITPLGGYKDSGIGKDLGS